MDFVGNIHDRVAPPPPAYPGKTLPKPELDRQILDLMKTPQVDKTKPIAQSTPLQRNSFSSSGSQRSTSSSIRSLSDRMPESAHSRAPESYWYKPNISRDEAVRVLRDGQAGDFIVRDSNSYQQCYGLAVRVERHQVPAHILASVKPGYDERNELVRHFLIDGSSKGVKLSGSDDAHYFPSLAALINQHAHTPLTLPVKLNIPLYDRFLPLNPELSFQSDTPRQENTISSSFYFLHESDTEMLTGDAAILRTFAEYSRQTEAPGDCMVQIKATAEGLTITDRQRKRFFRKHFPAETVSHCGLEPNRKSVKIGNQKLRVFGFVAKRSSSNVAILLTEKDKNSLDELIQFVNKVVMQPPMVSDLNGSY